MVAAGRSVKLVLCHCVGRGELDATSIQQPGTEADTLFLLCLTTLTHIAHHPWDSGSRSRDYKQFLKALCTSESGVSAYTTIWRCRSCLETLYVSLFECHLPLLAAMGVVDNEVESSSTYKLLSSCVGCLGVGGLARVAACSKQLRDTCITIAVRDVQSLLKHELEQAQAAAGKAGWEQHLQAVLWLLQAAPTAVAAAPTTEQLACLPCLPLRWALQIVTAGVHISYAQLLAAASSMVPGVEVWVQAQQQLGVQTDIPPAAAAVCCIGSRTGEVVSGLSLVVWLLLFFSF
jgi:hypothetical protein